ncbi:polymerase, nucleotidyl transferase domain [Phytophthora cactorum]|nr:polymerase, nucleotidyl transferase domain [Phytophthora cactorum]
MPEHRWPPPPPPRASVRPPSPPPDDQERPHQYRHSGVHRHNKNSKNSKYRTNNQPCIRTTRYDDPIWSGVYAMPRQVHQNYPQRQPPRPVNPPPMPKSDPVRPSSSFCLPPQRERASSFANHFKSHNNQSDDAPVLPSGKFLFKDAVLKQSKVNNPNQRRRKGTRPRKYSSSDGMPNLANGNAAELYLNPDYLFNPVYTDADITRAERAQLQQSRLREQQYYPRPLSATQQMPSVSPAYTRYLEEEQFHSNLSRQVEAFVDYIDTTLASMETHQQQAIDSLQELVRSLWPDALIDIYGSSYTRLALPVSDVDCVLVSRALAGERPLAILEALAAEVERQPWTKKLELLGSAKIPVLKMTYSLDPTKQDVLLDLTCGHSVGHTGLGARDLIYSLQTEMPALRPLVLILKSHLVNNNLNCAFTGGISSYVLVIMVIRFLQACGDTHVRSFASNTGGKVRGGNRRRSYSENASVSDFPEELAYVSSLSDAVVQPKWCYTFSRGGRVTWYTGIGSLLMLFLETYITFDYRRFGISIENEGDFFLLPPDKIVPMQCSVVIPYVADPIKPGRSICNCFRMHEVIQSWLALYQNLAAGVPVATCIGGFMSR